MALEDISDPFTGEVLVKANEEIDESAGRRRSRTPGIEKVKIRSVLTCQVQARGLRACATAATWPAASMVNIGEAVGVIAAQSIGEPGTQLTMRTFHIGGTASRRAEQSTLEARNDGTVKFVNLNTVQSKDGDLVVMNRNGEIAIMDENGPRARALPDHLRRQAQGGGRPEGRRRAT